MVKGSAKKGKAIHHLQVQGMKVGSPIQNDQKEHIGMITSISLMVGIVGCVIYSSTASSLNDSIKHDFTRGALTGALVFAVFGVCYLPKGTLHRPHPMFWKGVQAASILYLLFLIVLLHQNLNNARRIMGILDPSLGVPLPQNQKSYAQDCSISGVWPSLDIFVLAHIFGWFATTFLLRDYWLGWVLSVMFEILELSLKHHLPNFVECWWDSWILDVLICNPIGIWAGMKTCQYFDMKLYDWRKAASGSLRGYFGAVLVSVMHLLWMPLVHYMTLGRVLLQFLLGAVSMREVYDWATLPQRAHKSSSPSAYVWLNVVIIFLEISAIFKWGAGEFTAPFPQNVLQMWILIITMILAFPIWKFWLSKMIF